MDKRWILAGLINKTIKQMQFYLTESRLTKHCLILQPELHTVYKLIVKKSGEYYIGVTKDLQKRVDEHGHAISCLIISGGERNYKSDLNFHFKAAKTLMFNHEYNGSVTDKVVRTGIDIQVLAVVAGKKYAYFLEEKYIADAEQDELCCNYFDSNVK